MKGITALTYFHKIAPMLVVFSVSCPVARAAVYGLPCWQVARGAPGAVLDFADQATYEQYEAKARELAEARHAGQKSGEGGPYTDHLDDVEKVLVRFGYRPTGTATDRRRLIASRLHDLIEEGGMTADDIAALFDLDMGLFVDALSHDEAPATEDRRETARRVFMKVLQHGLATSVKLADRIANMESLLRTVDQPDQAPKIREFRIARLERYLIEHGIMRDVLFRPDADPRELKMWEHLEGLMNQARATVSSR